MKVCIIQPPYSVDHSQSDSYFEKELELMDQCDETMDLIVLPESYDTPCLVKGQEQRLLSYNSYNARFLEKARETARRCNAYVIRSSVSMGVDADVGGTSMVIAPDGTVLVDMEGRVGMETAEIDPHKRYLKPAGFGNAPDCHHHYVEAGRRPWKYRNAGSAIVPYDDIMAYPRICAHRGFNSVAPENSLPAYGAAVAMGAQEIEFDLWPSKDGVIVSIHDPVLDRVSDGTGNVWDYTYEELLKFDFGIKKGPKFAGMRIPTLEEILQKFAGHAIMNIHVKASVECPVTDEMIAEIARLIHKYDCERHCYFMQGSPKVLDIMRRVAPQIPRCAGHGDPKADIVQKALDYGCKKVQLFKPYFSQLPEDYVEVTCRRAHEHGIIVNLFYADNPDEARMYLAKGADTILTNDFNLVSQILK